MSQESQVWSQAAALFDELAERSPQERERILGDRDVAPEVRRWLDELLDAHDADHSLIIDRRIDDLARGLAGSPGAGHPDDLVGQRFGPWRARDTVGRGGMGLVLEGERADGRFEMRVAIKVLAPEALGESAQAVIEQEVRTLARLEHPGIARLVDGGVRDDGVAWLAMEYVDGERLDAWCERHRPSREERLALFRQVADAVSFCHRALVAHGDIKPGNVLVDDQGRARLLDFGIAARMAEVEIDEDAAAAGRWCSPGYASPERLSGRPPSIADDVFALGAVLFRLLTGRGIRSAPEQTRLLGGGAGGGADEAGPRFIGCGDADLDAVLGRALAADSDRRYRSVEALLDDLDRWWRGFPVSARNGGPAYRFRRWFGRHRNLATAGALALIALLVGTGVALWQADRARLAAERAERNAAAAQAAQARAEAINRFLLDLFEAEIPDLPPDEMPTTRQLVEQGIERARDPASGPPELRAELLMALAGILLSRRQLDQAEDLIGEARGLVDLESHPELAVRLAMLDVEQARRRNEFDTMEAALERAVRLLERHEPGSLRHLEMRRDLGRLHMRREQFERAEAILEDVQRAASQREDASDLQLRLAGDLAVLAGMSGRSQQALERFEEVLGLKRAQPDVSPLSLATTLVNLAGLHAGLGEYERAESRYREVLDLLRPFADLPQGTRATSLAGLADIRRWQGRFDEAETLLVQSAEEWRRLLGLESVDEDFFIHYYLAELYGDAGRFDGAVERMRAAIERMSAGQEAPPARIARARADLARYLCAAGRPDQARAPLDRARQVLGQSGSIALAEAEAICASGDAAAEGPVIDAATVARAREAAEDLSRVARLELARARVLVEAGEVEQARALVAAATNRLEAVGAVAGHPLLVQARALQADLEGR